MVNFRDSYFPVQWDITKKHLSGTFWGKQYDTGRGFAVTVINGGQVVTPTTEVLRLKWEKPDNTSGYVNATFVNGKFIVENIDQMFTVHGSVRADFELSVAGEFVASITFYVNVEKAVAVDAIESSSDFTALQAAIATADSIDAQLAQIATNIKSFGAVGDGISDDTFAIQQAIDSLPNGGTVLIPVGTYKITYSLMLGSNITLLGLGRNSVIKADLSNTICSAIANKNMNTNGGYTAAENIELNNFAIETNANGIGFAHAKDIRILNIFSDDNALTWHYVDLAGVKNAVVKGCTFINDGTGSGGDLVQLDTAIDTSVVMFLKSDGSYSGTLVDGTGTEDITIKDNYLEFAKDTSGLIVFHRDPVRNVRIEGNTLIGGYAGIYVQGGVNKEIYISNNYIENYDRSIKTYSTGATFGININASSLDYLTIKDNKLKHCGLSVTNVTDAIVLENNIIDTFYVSNGLNCTGHIVVKNNTVKNHKNSNVTSPLKNSLRVTGVSPKLISISNNLFDNSMGDMAQTGLRFDQVIKDIIINDNSFLSVGLPFSNVIRANTSGAIEFIGGAEQAKVRGNTFKNGISGVSFGSTGTNVNNVMITENNFKDISHPIYFNAKVLTENIKITDNILNNIIIGIFKNDYNKVSDLSNADIKGNTFSNIKGFAVYLEGYNLAFNLFKNKFVSGTFDADGSACPLLISAKTTDGALRGVVSESETLTTNNKMHISGNSNYSNLLFINNYKGFTPFWAGMENHVNGTEWVPY